MTHQDVSEILQPCKQPLYIPSAFVATQWPAVLRTRHLPVIPVRSYEFNFMVYCQLDIKGVAVVRLISYKVFRLFASDKTLGDSCFSKGDFMWRSRCNVYGDRKASTI